MGAFELVISLCLWFTSGGCFFKTNGKDLDPRYFLTFINTSFFIAELEECAYV